MPRHSTPDSPKREAAWGASICPWRDAILVGAPRVFCRRRPNQTEVTVEGSHLIHENAPDDLGRGPQGAAVSGSAR